jgi:protein involved in polysaccharide export with SLBB domain
MVVPQVQPPTITNQALPPRLAPTKPAARAEESARPAEPQATDRNDFQDFIAQSTGQTLPLYGYNLFQGAPSTFAPVENIPVTGDYVIGPGDELLIRAWGQIDVDYRAVVDRSGMINIPRVGSIPVAGVPYKDITAHVRTAVSRNFRNFELMVTMGQLRSIQIFLVGQARRPGAYTVSSLSTLVNAVFSAGGPSTRGSMRRIQLKRGASVVTELDLYDLIALGDKTKDAALLPGDVIYFLPVGQLVALSGSVNNPAIFELKGATNIGQLIDLAGGLSTTAQTRKASIERIEERQTRTVDQFSLDYDGLHRALKDGDLVSVYSISPRFENAVTLRGKVAAPLRYPYKPGMRIRDLIPEPDALITADYYTRKNLSVLSGPVLQGRLAYDVRRLADEINWDYAVIERLERNGLTTKLIPFNLGKVVLEDDDANNLALLPGDIVTVFSKSDIGAPAARRPIVVSLEGEFNSAGVYQAQPKETLRQLIARVGGVTPRAYLFGAEFTRESTRREQEERLKQAIDQLEQDLQRASATRARNVVSPEDATSLKQETEVQRSLVSRLRTLRPTGRIVFNIPDSATIADLPDIELEDGDRIVVPQNPSQVSVFGTVFNESSFVYEASSSVADYLKMAGGPRKQADRSSIYLLRANGSVVSARQGGFFWTPINRQKVMPGDAIVVPEDFERTTWLRDLKDWTQVFYQFGLGAAALKVIGN